MILSFLPLTCEQIEKSDPDQFSLLVVFNPFIVLFYCFFFFLKPLPAFITKPLSEPNTGKKHVNSGFIFINHKSYSCMEKIIRHSAETAARIDMSFITRNNARNSSYSNIKKFYNTLKSDVPPLESFCSKANGEKERFKRKWKVLDWARIYTGSRGTRKERKMFHLNCTYNNAKDRFRLLNLLKLELPVESWKHMTEILF